MLKLFVLIFLSSLALNAALDEHLKAYFACSQEPLVVVELAGGLSGAKNYKVTYQEKEYVLRLLNPSTSQEDRYWEIFAALHASKLGIGPHVHYVSAQDDAFIMDYIAGKTLSPQLLEEPQMLGNLVLILRKLHQSSGPFPRGQTVFARIEKNLQRLKLASIPMPREVDIAVLRAINEKFKNEPLVPCHTDLNALNILFDGTEFKLIDWTDASMGYAFMDLGFFALTNQIGETRHVELLTHYLGRAPSYDELELLRLAKKVSCLRLFTTILLYFEFPLADAEARAKRELELEEMLQHTLPMNNYFDLHSKGLLKEPSDFIGIALSALRAFLEE